MIEIVVDVKISPPFSEIGVKVTILKKKLRNPLLAV